MENTHDARELATLIEQPGCALFLDFDGTLVDLAATPDSVTVAPGLVDALAILGARLDGALAIISGRPIAQIDAMLAPLMLPVAGVHGIERRDANGQMHYAATPSCDAAQLCAMRLAAEHKGLLVEQKRGAVALHYRLAPHLEQLCLAEMAAAVRDCPGMLLLHGKMVLEVKPVATDKGGAIRDFLAEVPFAGRRPVFAGDDTTDEAGFVYVQQAGGTGLKVGAGPSVALARIGGVQILHDALLRAAHLTAPKGN